MPRALPVLPLRLVRPMPLAFWGLGLAPTIFGLTACDSWPRYANLPDPDAVIDVDLESPEDRVPMTWTTASEADLLASPGADNGDPRGARAVPAAPLQGLEIDGVLRGIGFNAGFQAPLLQGDGCPDARRLPDGSGDWAGDVDFYRITLEEPAVICAQLSLPGQDLGWDLLLFPLDVCGLPGAPVEEGEDPLGWNRAGEFGGWKMSVTPGAWGVMVAGYEAPEPVAEYAYTLAISAVPVSTDQPGTELCPSFPAGGP